jgi:hypothetical protein
MRRVKYEPSTSGWNTLAYRRRESRRRVAYAVGGATLLLAGAIAGLLLTVGPAEAISLVR